MKKLPMLLLAIAPYVFLLFVLFSVEKGIYSQIRIVIILYLSVLLLNLIYAFRLPRLGFEVKQIMFWNMLLKLCHIPAYVFVFLLVVLLHVFIIPLLPFLILFDYILLLTSSAYGISGLLRCYMAKEITMKTLVVNIAAQLIFCTDVFSSIFCYRMVRKSNVYSSASSSL